LSCFSTTSREILDRMVSPGGGSVSLNKLDAAFALKPPQCLQVHALVNSNS
jgi:hypothetical protein